MTATMGDLLVLGQGSANWQTETTAPTGAMLGAAANNNGNAQVAAATHVLKSAGASPALDWNTAPAATVERLQHPGAPPGVPRCEAEPSSAPATFGERLGHADTHRDADTDSYADRHADAVGDADTHPHADGNPPSSEQPELARVRTEHSPGEDLRLHGAQRPHIGARWGGVRVAVAEHRDADQLGARRHDILAGTRHLQAGHRSVRPDPAQDR